MIASTVAGELLKLAWSAPLAPPLLEVLVDVPLSASHAAALREKLLSLPHDVDAAAVAKQLLHYCEQRGAEWVPPLRSALARVRTGAVMWLTHDARRWRRPTWRRCCA